MDQSDKNPPESKSSFRHYSVLAEEVLSYLAPEAGRASLLVDGTLGPGGHSLRFLKDYPELRVIGVDADEAVLRSARERLAEYRERIVFKNMWFDEFFEKEKELRADRILLDLGVSLFHFKESGRGFSFTGEEPLDMRLDHGRPEPGGSVPASEVLMKTPENELRDIFSRFGEERFSGRIAAAIVRERAGEAICRTDHLVRVIEEALPARFRFQKKRSITRVFQALRLFVNQETRRLQKGLKAALELLNPGGRMAVISFHSLEDRIVKQTFREREKSDSGTWKRVVKKPLLPSAEEIEENKPSRSAKMRVIERGA